MLLTLIPQAQRVIPRRLRKTRLDPRLLRTKERQQKGDRRHIRLAHRVR
jgi:hypothetical protein